MVAVSSRPDPDPESASVADVGPDVSRPRGLASRLTAPGMWVVWLIAALCCAIEAGLVLADYGVIGSPLWRQLSYQYGAFWAGLLADWQPNYSAQPVTMFASYQFLHAGPSHLLGNMLALVWLGALLAPAYGARRFAALYMASVLGGAAMFGLVSSSGGPMVGASGALFGLAGAWVVHDWRLTRRPPAEGGQGPDAARVWALQMVAFLVLINLASWLMQGGVLAWQTHLGGGLTGAAAAAILRPRPGQSPTQT